MEIVSRVYNSLIWTQEGVEKIQDTELHNCLEFSQR